MTGILIIDKPEGMTSHTVISVLRGITHVRRIGHAGTLDPMATGVLPICIGRATRAADYVADAPKQYRAVLALGVETDTEDATGSVIRTCTPSVGARELLAVLPTFTGEIEQIPPMYSAIQKDGKRLYKLARKGVVVERTPRRITVYGLQLEEADEERHRYTLQIDCSKGTYVRTLCSDIGRALGCGGMMAALRRTACGGYTEKDALTLDEIRAAAEAGELEEKIRDTDTAFLTCPAVTLSEEGETRLCNGLPVEPEQFGGRAPSGLLRIYGPSGFLGIGYASEEALRCTKRFFDTTADPEE